ncbi:Fe-S cluster assembly protein IscX [Myxococcota bacterium]|nr:Fe-S cluster assembly protein IscX [Myxococcota bacterium]
MGALPPGRRRGDRTVTLDWNEAQEIGISLYETHPDVDPLTVRFTDLHRWVLDLPGFTGDPKGSNEKLLEAIQMAWLEEWKLDHE